MLAIERMAERLAYHGDASMFGEVCSVTGRTTSYPVRRETMTTDSMPLPEGEYVDQRVAAVLSNGNLRWASWTWTETGGLTERASKAHVRAMVHEPPNEEWAIYAAEDMRRHGGLLTRVCSPGEPGDIQFGGRVAARAYAVELYAIASDMFARGVSRAHLLNVLDAPARTIERFGVAAWAQAIERIRPHARSAEWRFACWMLPTKAEQEGT